MEDRRPGPEEPTEQDNEATPKKRRGGDFLSQYLLRRKEQSGEDLEEEDNEETEEKPKKFRRFFKGLFKNVVRPPEQEDESRPVRIGLEALFLATPEHHTEDTDPHETENEAQEAHASPEATYESTGVPQTEPKESIATPQRLETNTVEARESSEFQQIEQSETHENTPQPTENMEHPLPVIPAPEYAPPIDRTLFERNRETPAEKEVVIERGPGMALPVVLVGAEYLARKRADRKLDEKFSTKVESIEKEAKQSKFSQQELNTLVEQNREQLETLKRERGITPEKRETPAQPEAKSVLEKPAQQPESRKPEIIQEEPEKTETYKIMEQVAEAAEQNAPVERVFERSHEVKDDQSIPVGAASVGAIMAAQAEQKRIAQLHASKTYRETDNQGLPVINTTSDSDMYKQAMRRGFWGAIIIIVFGLVAYLLK